MGSTDLMFAVDLLWGAHNNQMELGSYFRDLGINFQNIINGG